MYKRQHNLNLYQPSKQVVTEKVEVDIHTEELDNRIGAQLADKLRGELELIYGVYPEFDKEEYLKGEPVSYTHLDVYKRQEVEYHTSRI